MSSLDRAQAVPSLKKIKKPPCGDFIIFVTHLSANWNTLLDYLRKLTEVIDRWFNLDEIIHQELSASILPSW